MKINADPSLRAVVLSEQMDWIASPLPGVHRRMLERDGEEVARATSIVRYAPNSHFSAHGHALGEEFLVLEGVFSDEHGDYGPGFYVRNPPGSSHTPRSDDGCVIFVKLRQMDPSDDVNLWHDPAGDHATAPLVEGVEIVLLHEDVRERVEMLRFQAGAKLPARDYPGGQEFLVVEGELLDENATYPKGAWVRNPAGTQQTAHSPNGCLLYMKTDHLG